MRQQRPHARFRARAEALRLAHRRRWVALVSGLLLLAAAVWAIGFSPLVAVRTIEVSGARGPLADTVRALSDDVVGTPTVRADTGDIRRRVAALPAVRTVTVSRSLPSTVRVTVQPRTPVVIVEQAGSRRLVDADGVAYAPVTGRIDLPVVRIGEGGVSGSAVASVATVMGALPPADRARAQDVRVTRTGQVSFTLGGIAVSWGDASRSPAKARTLRALRPETTKEGTRRIDVSAPTRPVLG